MNLFEIGNKEVMKRDMREVDTLELTYVYTPVNFNRVSSDY